MNQNKPFPIPEFLINYRKGHVTKPSNVSNKRLTLSRQLLSLLRSGETTIPRTQRYTSLIAWLEHHDPSKESQTLYYLKQVIAEDGPQMSVTHKKEIWLSASR